MTLKEAEELLDACERRWTEEWHAQAGPYEQSLSGQQQARLCQEYIRERAQEEVERNPDAREALRKLESQIYRFHKKRERLEAEQKAYTQFHDDITALWDKHPQYQTLGELMKSPEAVELRRRYWQDEARKRGEL